MQFEFDDGTILADTPAGWSPYSLFALDLCDYYHAITAPSSEAVQRNRFLTQHAMRLASQIEEVATAAAGSKL
jgi:Tfp pilus assembly protein PilN